MRLDRSIRNERQTLQHVLEALDHNLNARDNFAPEGEIGQVLTSNGPNEPPTYQSPTSMSPADYYTRTEIDELLGEHSHDGADITSGQVRPQFLGSGTRDGTRFLRDDGVWSTLSPVAWADISGQPSNFAGYGLDDDLAAALGDYYTVTQLDAGQLDTRYYTETEVDALFAALSIPADTTDLGDWPAHAAGYLKNDGAGAYSWDTPSGGGSIDGSGSANRYAYWTDADTLSHHMLAVATDEVYLAAGGSSTLFGIAGAAGTQKQIRFYAGTGTPNSGDLRWILAETAEAESGSNAGSNLQLLARTDAGGALDTVMSIIRSNSEVSLGGDLTFISDNVDDIGFSSVARRPRSIFLGTAVWVNGFQILTTRQTGWGAPTATLSRTAVATGQTLATTVSQLAALVTDLRTHGIIGN